MDNGSSLSIPRIGSSSVGSTLQRGSAASWPGSPASAGSSPEDHQAEMARRNLKRILHLNSPLSSVENSSSPSPGRVVKSAGKVVPPMKVGTKEDDVLVMDAVPIQFPRGMEEQRGSRFIKPHKSEEERWAQRSPRTPQTPSPTTSMTSPLSKEDQTPKKQDAELAKRCFWTPEQKTFITKEEKRTKRSRTPQIIPSVTSPSLKETAPKNEESVPETKDFIWPPSQEEEAIITKVLYTPSGKKRLPVFESICPK